MLQETQRPINRIDTNTNVLGYFDVDCICFPREFFVAMYTSLAFTRMYHRYKSDIVKFITLQSHTSFSLYFVKYTRIHVMFK